ncbi:MAG: GNAT family N-acetyltransferase [Candidatus Omnitrophota bacterium]|nr:GNAT family N-acetyltransferase [Candidatus Omnitrophota bacterium]
MDRYTVTAYKDLDKYENLWVNGELTHSGRRHPFLDFSWFKIYAKHFLNENSINIQIYREKDKITIFPMARANDIFQKTSLMGRKIFDYGDIITNSNNFSLITDFLENSKTCMAEFFNVREDSPLQYWAKQLSAQSGKKWQTLIVDSVKSPYVSLEGNTWDDYFKRLSRNFKDTTKRKIKKMASLGKIHFGYCKDESEAAEVFETMCRQHIERRKYLGQSKSIFLNKKTKLFYREINQKMILDSKMLLFYLKLNSEIIAVTQCFLRDKVIYYYMPTFDLKYSACSPGRVLLYYIIKFGFEDGMKEVDFMIGDEEYKLRWNARIRQTRDIYFFKKNILGQAAFLRARMQIFNRRVKEKLIKSKVKDIRRAVLKRLYKLGA